MRVVAGTAGGLLLRSPATDARPTMDRVRGAIFSSLGNAVPGARVLDLFAGSGALGIEALSRGAAAAVFVESNARAVRCIRENLAHTRLEGEVCREDVYAFLKRSAAVFDIIFADPPYVKGPVDPAATLLASPRLPLQLTREGLLVLERAPTEEVPPRWRCLRRKRYGSTEVLMLQPHNEEI